MATRATTSTSSTARYPRWARRVQATIVGTWAMASAPRSSATKRITVLADPEFATATPMATSQIATL
jgi:hypothetical protein